MQRISILSPESEADFERYYELRWRILRAPWQQPRGSERDALEGQSWHRMACRAMRIPLGVARLHFNSPHQAQIRYMAVETAEQRQGIGRDLTREMERLATQLGATEIILHARESCLDFYRRQDYRIVEPSHKLFDTIPHFLMRKSLD